MDVVPAIMERDNFNPYNFESSAEKQDDKKDEKKKKSATGLARLIAREEAQREADKAAEKQDDRNFLQKLVGETKPEEAEQTKDNDGATEEKEVAALEALNTEEEIAVAETYIEERAQQLTSELQEGEQPPQAAAEVEANRAFLEALQEHLSEQGDEADVDGAVEAAYDDVAAELGAEVESVDELEDPTEPLEQSDEPQDLDPNQAVPLTGGGAGQPPLPPRPPSGVSGPRGASFGASGGRRSPNVAPGQYDDADVQRFERSAMGRGLLVGGVIGYLIGRRRGRIKTEKRLKSVQEKLEQQVVAVQQKIEQKELVIRKLAREKVTMAATATSAERITTTPKQSYETAKEKSAASHATAEQAGPRTAEAAKATVDSLNKDELLAFSAQIRVGETNLRRVFEAQMVDEKGLRRLIKEYQAGHDLRRALAREFLVKELKFERDPTLRDLLPPETQPRRQTKNNDASSQYGEGAAVPADIVSEQAASTKAGKQGDATSNRTNSQMRRTGRQSNVSTSVLVGLTLLTIGLAIYAIWLTLTR